MLELILLTWVALAGVGGFLIVLAFRIADLIAERRAVRADAIARRVYLVCERARRNA